MNGIHLRFQTVEKEIIDFDDGAESASTKKIKDTLMILRIALVQLREDENHDMFEEKLNQFYHMMEGKIARFELLNSADKFEDQVNNADSTDELKELSDDIGLQEVYFNDMRKLEFSFSTVKSKKVFFTADKLKIAFFPAEKPKIAFLMTYFRFISGKI